MNKYLGYYTSLAQMYLRTCTYGPANCYSGKCSALPLLHLLSSHQMQVDVDILAPHCPAT